jgi:hypothetical protein
LVFLFSVRVGSLTGLTKVSVSVNEESVGVLSLAPEEWELLRPMLANSSTFYQDGEATIVIEDADVRHAFLEGAYGY